jgi:hypothetical protein
MRDVMANNQPVPAELNDDDVPAIPKDIRMA